MEPVTRNIVAYINMCVVNCFPYGEVKAARLYERFFVVDEQQQRVRLHHSKAKLLVREGRYWCIAPLGHVVSFLKQVRSTYFNTNQKHGGNCSLSVYSADIPAN